MLPLLPHGGENDCRDGSDAHDEEGAGGKVGRQRRHRAGEVRREPLRCRRIASGRGTAFFVSKQFSQRNRSSPRRRVCASRRGLEVLQIDGCPRAASHACAHFFDVKFLAGESQQRTVGIRLHRQTEYVECLV